jgi:D-alanyl-D-alanine carboxypeptidase
LLGAATASRSVELQAAQAAATEPNQALPAQVQLPLAPLPTPALPMQAADQTQQTAISRLPFNPSLGLPPWLRTVQSAPLWSAAGLDASQVGALDVAGAFVKPLGRFDASRVQVYFPGDEKQVAVQGWIDATNVEPAAGVPGWIAPGPSVAGPARVSDAPPPDTTAVHIAIVDDDSGELMYGEQPFTEVPQASTTKIATTIVALEREPDLSRRIKVTVSASAMVARDGSSTMGIEPGRSVSLDTLLHGMMLPSGNDAAEQVAVALADSREQYVDWMNQEALALGLRDTHFVNPSGMDAAGHYSSAYDMAMLARYAMHNATFRSLAAATSYAGDGYPMSNLNRLLASYPGTDGVKIGFTDAAQKTIVASAVRDGHRVYISLMRSQDLVGDCTALFNWVWKSFSWQ